MAVFAVFLFSHPVLSQTPLPQASPSPVKSDLKPKERVTPVGSISGQVTADDLRVLANTLVVARSSNGAVGAKVANVDNEGRFVLNDVPAAIYLVFATTPGYIDESLVVTDLNQLPRHLIGSEVRLRLVKGGVITGTVTNSRGEPLVGVPVRAASNHGIGAFMGSAGGATQVETDDRGIYRIYGLPPGQYTVDAGGGQQMGRFVTTGFELDIPTFHPSSTYDTAVPVTVRAGEETSGIDIRYRGAEGRSVSGKVTGNADNPLAPAMSVVLAYAGTTTPVSTAVVGTNTSNRSFSFDGVADGEYDVTALVFVSPTENLITATRRVVVKGSDVTGVELVLASLGSIAGNIKLEPIAPENKCDQRNSELMEMQIEVSREEPTKAANKMLMMVTGGLSTSFLATGDFSVNNLESGIYRPRVKPPTEAWYTRSITFSAPASGQTRPGAVAGSSDPASGPTKARTVTPTGIWTGTVTLKPGSTISGISVTVGQDAAGLRGRVIATPEKAATPPNLQVHLVPMENADANNVLRYFESAVERDGNFVFKNIPPGSYFMLPRIKPQVTTDENLRPLAFDPTARATLRRAAEALKNIVELKPCQRAVDVALPLESNQ